MSAREWRRGLVEAVDGATARARVRFPDLDGLLSDWLPVAQASTLGLRVYLLPPVGSQVVVLLDEHGEDGVVLGALYSQADPTPTSEASRLQVEFPDGSRATWSGGALEVEAYAITLKGSVKVDGPLAVTEDATIQGRSFLQHQHQAQGSTAITTAPV